DDIEELNEDLEELKNISDLIDEQEKRKIAALIAKLYIVHHNEISLATFDKYKTSKRVTIPIASSSLLTSCFGIYEDISSFEFTLTYLEFIIGEVPTYYTVLGLEIEADLIKSKRLMMT
ncbi:8164_t:CDS:2, partial [Funneliformis geosporum]